MLAIDLVVIDRTGRKLLHSIKAERGEAHPKLKHHFYYDYAVKVDGSIYEGQILHDYDNGPFALTQKICKDIVALQKAAKNA